jgi:hypothetical protein
MRKKDTPITEELVIRIMKDLGGQGDLDEIDEKLSEEEPALMRRIQGRYPTNQLRRSRLVWILTQTGSYERVGKPGSGRYQIRQGPHPWRRR